MKTKPAPNVGLANIRQIARNAKEFVEVRSEREFFVSLLGGQPSLEGERKVVSWAQVFDALGNSFKLPMLAEPHTLRCTDKGLEIWLPGQVKRKKK